MTDAERSLIAHFLNVASDYMSRRGSHDFDLSILMPDKAERDALYREYEEWNSQGRDYDATRSGDAPDYRLPNFCVASLLAKKVSQL